VKRKHHVQTCIVAALSLLAVVFSMWMKPPASFEAKKVSKSEQVCCAVPTSSTFYLAEIKPRISGCTGGAGVTICFSAPSLCVENSKTRLSDSQVAPVINATPIWLLHRSLLI
jgi:hypothetical protein